LFFLNASNINDISLSEGNWIYSESISIDFIEKIKSKKYKVAFVKEENIFSHGMNVLRKIISNNDIIIVVGIKEIAVSLQNAKKCNLNIKDDIISIDDIEYQFRHFDYFRDTSEVIEYNIDTNEICYKPDYYYNSELASIIVDGYNMTNMLLPYSYSARKDSDGRIWNKGYVFPYQLFEYFLKHKKEYYANMLNYIGVLKKIYSLGCIQEVSNELIESLKMHYSYSTMFSFIIPNISEQLIKMVGIEGLEEIYKFFVLNSPIHSKYELTIISIEKMEKFLKNILDGITNSENYLKVYEAHDIPCQDLAIMYFVTNMFSDIRRCIINMTIENNSWFESVCQHRKKIKIY